MRLGIFVIILVSIQPVASLMCYFCADSSSEKGKNQCQTWHRTMRYYRKKAEETGSYRTEKYVKNCTDYGPTGSKRYCMISSIELRNDVKSFIRDCSDGTTFFSADIDLQFKGDILRPDNQTTCRYTGQGYLACVTICGDEYGFGHFCNGPRTTSLAIIKSGSLYFALFLAFLSVFEKNVIHV